jgi:fermentation-respiration switch protein FrsA (DUF1100 family)
MRMVFVYATLGLVVFAAVFFSVAAFFVQKTASQRPDNVDRNHDPAAPERDNKLSGETPFRKMAMESNIWWNSQELERYEVISHDGLKLVGHLLKAEKPTRRVAMVLHGHQCSSGEMGFVARMFRGLGLHVFMPDQRAHGKSEGKFYGMGFYEKDDAIRWLNMINAVFGDDCEIVMHGISMGAATVMMTAPERDMADNVVCGIADCGFTRADEAALAVLETSFGFLPLKRMTVRFASGLNKLRAGYRLEQADCVGAVAHTRIPLLFIHGSEDQTVPFRMMDTLYGACSGQKEKLAIDGAKHGVAYFQQPELYTKTVRDFIGRFFTIA